MKRKIKDQINIWFGVLLVALNLFVFNAIIADWTSARVDLTQYKEHSLSPYTKKVLKELPDRVEVVALFSESTHKLLKPLIPRIQDILEDYVSESEGKVSVIFEDPKKDASIKKIYEEYGIKPMPVPLETKFKKEVKSIYFDLVIRFGDQTVKYGIDDIIKVKQGEKGPIVTLKNIESLITKGIKKATTSFASMDSVMEGIDSPVEIYYFKLPDKYKKNVPPKQLKDLKEAEAKLKKAVEDLEKKYKGKIKYTQKDAPSQEKVFVVEVAHNSKTVDFPLFMSLQNISKSDVSDKLTMAFKRVLPGFGKTIGLVTPKVAPPVGNPMMRQAPPDIYKVLDDLLGSEYTVLHPDLSSGEPPVNIDVLLVIQPENLSEKEVYAIDQYVMLGGKLAVFADRGKLDLASLSGNRLKLKYVKTGIDLLLANWGVTFEDKILADKSSFPYPLPRELQPGLVVVEDTPYQYFVKVKPNQSNPVTAGLELINLTWPGALTYHASDKNIKQYTLLGSSSDSWLMRIDETAGLDVTPDKKKGQKLVPDGTKTKSEIVALSLEGKFSSLYKTRKSPFEEDEKSKNADKKSDKQEKNADKKSDKQKKNADKKSDKQEKNADKKIKKSSKVTESPKTKIVVVADADFISDLGMKIAENRYEFSYKFLHNVIDWLQSDDDTVSVAPKGLPRPLEDIPESRKSMIQHMVWVISLLILAGIFALLLALRRRNVK